jgi:hypothetical protein
MFFSYFTLFVALSVSAIAAWYSIIGLTAIFAAAVVPIIIMGAALEVSKITATVWLHQYWDQARWLMKLYLASAVIILMIITSMGIFGFLSRAHIEQNAPIGDSVAQMEIIDERIAIEQEVIEQYRRDLAILNQQIERFSELGAVTRGVNTRAAQQEERQAIFDRIEQSQQTITDLRQQRAPFAADVRKIETEVGPIKYIAALIYGDNPDQNLLEKAVRWVIILLVVVFDPLAIMLVLAGVESIKWNREQRRNAAEPVPAYEPDDGALTDEQLAEIQEAVDSLKESSEPQSILEQHPYLSQPFTHFKNLKPMVAPAASKLVDDESMFEELPEDDIDKIDDTDDEDCPHVKAAMREWKQQHPGQTVKHQRELLEQGRIDQLPWMSYIEAVPDVNTTTRQHLGTAFPIQATKGDTFIKLDSRPTRTYKFNGAKWIEVDKSTSDLYTYNKIYIDWLIEKLSVGEYDPELLTDTEQEQIAERIKQTKGT